MPDKGEKDGKERIFSTNGAGASGHPRAKKTRTWTQTLHPSQKLIHAGSQA